MTNPFAPHRLPPATVKQAFLETERETWAEEGLAPFSLLDALAALEGRRTGPSLPEAPSWQSMEGLEPGAQALLLEGRALSFGQARERIKDRQGPLSMTMAHMASLELLADRIRTAGHRTAIVCGAGPLGWLAVASLARAGVEVLALTDRNLRKINRRAVGLAIVPLKTGLSLLPGAALVTALASDKALTDELHAVCLEAGLARPQLFRIAQP